VIDLIDKDPSLSDKKNKNIVDHLKRNIKSNINWSRVS